MKNKKLNLGMAALVASMIMVGCGTTDTEKPDTPETNQEGTTTEGTIASGKLTTAYEAVKTAMGEDYLPSMLNEDPELINGLYGLDTSLCEAFIVETPMIGMHPDLFIGVEAKDGQADAVETALNTYKENLLNDTMQYPMNLPKIAAIDVLRVDNYVFLALMGYSGEVAAEAEVADPYAITEEEEAKINEEITAASKELTQKALTAAKEALTK